MPTVTVEASESRFRGVAAVTLRSGEVTATFLPDLGLTGVSLCCKGREFLALPGGIPRLRAGGTLGLPLLAPWANRLGAWRYRVRDTEVDLDGLPLPTDGRGLPIHGLLLGRPGWRVTALAAGGDSARLDASIDVVARAFPFPHRIEVAAVVHEDRLDVDTKVVPTGERPVPIAFGWHPYLRLRGTPRQRWRLQLPSREHVALDARGIPTGETRPEESEHRELGSRHFDDLYALGHDRRLAFTAEDGSGIELHNTVGYPNAQVWVPPGRTYAALEPMTAPTNALVAGTAPLVHPGDAFTARFSLGFPAP